MTEIHILSGAEATTPFADEVAKAADSERKALGFIAKSAYAKACAAGRILVAVRSDRGGRSYIGHVLFGGASSELHIHQLYVVKAYRRRNIAKRLIDAAVALAEARNYLGIAVRVAKDLAESKQVWERLGFRFTHSVKGGKSRRRIINLGHRELKTKSLLQFMQGGAGQEVVAFSVPSNVGRGTPTYIIDLNVYFDCLKDRGRRPAAQSLFRAALSTLFRLRRTKEFTKELERNSAGAGPDPILELARALPEERYEPVDTDESLRSELARRIFPERAIRGRLTQRDQSDINHLIIAVRSRAAGFITSERAMLMQRDWMRQAHGVDIVSVEEVVGVLKDAIESGEEGRTMALRAPTFEVLELERANEQDLADLRTLPDGDAAVRKFGEWARESSLARPLAMRSNGKAIAASGWRLASGPPRRVEALLVIGATSAAATSVVDFSLETLVRQASQSQPVRIDLSTPDLPDRLQRVLLDHGFTRTSDTTRWVKVSVGHYVSPSQWSRIAHDLAALSGLELPPRLMEERFSYGKPLETRMEDGRSWTGSLDDVESLFSPTILLYPDRPGTLIPIRSTFCEELFGGVDQGRLFESPLASFRRERIYYSGSRSFSLFERGNTLLFYESEKRGGRKGIVAVARALGSRTVLKSKIPEATLARGVLDKKEIDSLGGMRPTVTAISFDNVILLPRIVPLALLRENGWVPGHNFVGATGFPGHIVRQILELSYR